MTQERNGRPLDTHQGTGQHQAATTTTRSSLPRRTQSLWLQLEAWNHATPQQRRSLAVAVSAGRQTAQDNRARVLAHPDLAQRLLSLGCSSPERWNGYIPPRVAYFDKNGYGVPNDSPVRRGLVALIDDVAQRERER